jgi:hypothetical protein
MADHCHSTPGMSGQTSRRNLLKSLPAFAVLPAVAAVPAMAASVDPITDLCERYVSAFQAWEDAGELEGEGDFDGPLTTALDAEKSRLIEAIEITPITTPVGFAAFCRFVHVDNYMRDQTNEFPDVRRWQWLKIMEWVEARNLIGGAA